LAPIEPAIAIDSVRLPGEFHPDPADRIIVATARFHHATLLTADQAILAYGRKGHVDVIAD
jgi:PIN domain nuclease of toxin-antitoxin system